MPRQMGMPVQIPTVPQTGHIVSTPICVHGRLIDDVLTRNGKRTGKVRCLECKTILDDPYRGLK